MILLELEEQGKTKVQKAEYLIFRLFVWVAARLLHTSGVRSALASVSLRGGLTRIRGPVLSTALAL